MKGYKKGYKTAKVYKDKAGVKRYTGSKVLKSTGTLICMQKFGAFKSLTRAGGAGIYIYVILLYYVVYIEVALKFMFLRRIVL